MATYYLKGNWQGEDEWQEVTKEAWIKAERQAGFRPKGVPSDSPKYRTTCATGGFSGGGVSGRIRYGGED